MEERSRDDLDFFFLHPFLPLYFICVWLSLLNYCEENSFPEWKKYDMKKKNKSNIDSRIIIVMISFSGKEDAVASFRPLQMMKA